MRHSLTGQNAMTNADLVIRAGTVADGRGGDHHL
jgi:hypothetical protein